MKQLLPSHEVNIKLSTLTWKYINNITCLFTYGYLMQSAIYKNDIWFARYRHNSVRLYNIYNKDTLKADIDIINSITASPIGYW